MQLLISDGGVPRNLGVHVIGQEANVAGPVIADSGRELGRCQHAAGVE